MLSIKNVSIEQASTYYSQDNYYTKQRGEFWGKAIEGLGFTKELTHKNFIHMLHGENSAGEKLRREKEDGKTRAGYDHTFTAPKSLSILLEMAEATGNTALAEAIRKIQNDAVNVTLKHIEKNYMYTRTRTENGRVHEQTTNLIAAKFEHDTSRELDPTLHTHCVIANMTQDSEGNWKSVSNEELYLNKMANGLYYRSEVAASLKELGFEIEITNTKQGLFELKEIDKSLILEFSKRAVQIKEKMVEMRVKYPNASEAELKQYATLESRSAKKDVDRNEVYAENLARAKALVDTDELLSKFQIQNQSQQFEKVNIKELKEQAAQILTEQESTFSKEDILKIVTKLNLGTVRGSDIFYSELEDDSNIVKLGKNIFTTKEMLFIEKEIINHMQQTKNTKAAITTDKYIKNYIAENYITMTEGQKEALTHISTSTDAIIGIQGDAGTGKTYMLQALNQYIDKSKYDLRGLAFTGKAAGELEEQSGIKSQTLHSFLNQDAEPSEKEKVYIVDEASLVGSKQINKLIEKAKSENARIVLIGDTNQFATISAGAIFDQLQQHGMNTAKMTETLRQKTQLLKDVVSCIKIEDTDKALEILEQNNLVIETQNIIYDVVEEYIKDTDTLIIASTNAIRKGVNAEIRKITALQNMQTVTIRENANLIATEAFFAQNYQEGSIIFVNKNMPGLKPGTEAIISSIDKDKNKMAIKYQNKNGRELIKEIDIAKHGDCISSYTQTEKEFGINEKIMFTKNDTMVGVLNGDTAIIKSIDKNGNIKADMKGKTISFNVRQYRYLDYGYSTTDYKAQGATGDNVIIAADAKMATTNSFNVQLTRAKFSVKVFTDNIERLKENVQTAQSKTTTLLNELKETSKTLAISSQITNVAQSEIQNIDANELESKIEEIKSNKEAQNERSNIKRTRDSTLARDSQSAENNLRTATENLRDAHRNLSNADRATVRGTVAERLSEREFNNNQGGKRDMREVVEAALKFKKEVINPYNIEKAQREARIAASQQQNQKREESQNI